jgi:hypothetical protein
VGRLRRKLDAGSNAGPSLIRTERGAGYTFTAPVEVLRQGPAGGGGKNPSDSSCY